MIDQLMQLHKCADCPIRCQAMKKPHSAFARMHRWHQTWWPGWKIYQRELRAQRTMRVLDAAVGEQASPSARPQELQRGVPARAPELVQGPAAA
jgi:hypothetical protein